MDTSLASPNEDFKNDSDAGQLSSNDSGRQTRKQEHDPVGLQV